MILVRETFIARPGMASKLASMFKEMDTQQSRGKGYKVLTDMTGVFNKVVVETEYEDVAAFENDMKGYMEQAKSKPGSKSPHIDLYTEGKREIFRIW